VLSYEITMEKKEGIELSPLSEERVKLKLQIKELRAEIDAQINLQSVQSLINSPAYEFLSKPLKNS